MSILAISDGSINGALLTPVRRKYLATQISLDFIGFKATEKRLAAGRKMVGGEAAATPRTI